MKDGLVWRTLHDLVFISIGYITMSVGVEGSDTKLRHAVQSPRPQAGPYTSPVDTRGGSEPG